MEKSRVILINPALAHRTILTLQSFDSMEEFLALLELGLEGTCVARTTVDTIPVAEKFCLVVPIPIHDLFLLKVRGIAPPKTELLPYVFQRS